MKKLIILGSGSAGLTAAIYAGRAGLDEVIQAIAAAGADNHDVTGE